MDLLQKTKELCCKYDIHPARSKGQNFLISESAYDKIVEAADLKPDDIVLEVGPGFGFLTTKLTSQVKKVIAVELDDKLASVLKAGLAAQGIGNVEVVNENILEFRNLEFGIRDDLNASGIKTVERNATFFNPPSPLAKGGYEKAYLRKEDDYKIVANLPYNITSFFLRKFLSIEHKPEMMVLMLQKEVAERIVAQPPKMSLLAVSVQFYAQPEIMEYVPKNNFWPEPEVDSAIVKIKILNPPSPLCEGGHDRIPLCGRGASGSVDKEKEFFRMVKIGFSARRKMLKNNLAAGYQIDNEKAENYLKLAKIPITARAQELSVKDWVRLFEVIR